MGPVADTQRQMLSSTGESSAVHIRFHYTQMRDDSTSYARAHLPSDVRSPDVTRPRPIVHEAVSPKRVAAPILSALPNMFQPAQCSRPLHADSSSYVPAQYKSYDAQVAEGFEGMQTLRIVPEVPAKPIFIRSCRSKGDFPLVFEIAGLAESITVSACSSVRIVAAMVINSVHVVTSDNIEIVLGGQAPRVTLSGVQCCSVTLHKDTWNGDIECLASSNVSVNAVEGGQPDTLSLQESTAMERILLPDSMRTLVQEGRMTTQCHFTHLDTRAEEPPPLVEHVRPAAQRTSPAPPITQLDHPVGPQLGQQSERSERFGVGLLLKKSEDGLLQVARVAEGGAADRDGRVRAGDILAAIDGIETRGKKLRDVGEELSGPRDSEVWIRLLQVDPLSYDGARLEKHIVLCRAPISTSTNDSLSSGPQQLAPPDKNLGFNYMPPHQPSAPDFDSRLRDTRTRIEKALNDVGGPVTRVGVGLIVKPSHDGAYRVSGLVRDSAAEGSGQIAIGDVLHSVDGINVCFKSEDAVKNLVQGLPESRVVLSFLLSSAQPEDLMKSVDEFDNWRPVVLARAPNPSGNKTPPVAESEEEPIQQVAIERSNNVALARSAALPVATASLEQHSPPRHLAALPVATDPREQHSPPRHQEPIGLTLYLDEDFSTVAGNEFSRQAFAADLAADLCNSVQTNLSRIQVVDLLPGSVLADVHIFPSPVANDTRSPERLAAEIAVQVVDPQSPLRKANTTRNAHLTEIRGPISEVGSLREAWTASRHAEMTSPFVEHGGDSSLQSNHSPPLPPRLHDRPLSPKNGDLSRAHDEKLLGTKGLSLSPQFSPRAPSPTPSRSMQKSPTSEHPMQIGHEDGMISPSQSDAAKADGASSSQVDVTDGLAFEVQKEKSRATRAAAPTDPMLHSYTPSEPVNGHRDREEEERKSEQEAMLRLLSEEDAVNGQSDRVGSSEWEKPVEMIVKLGLDFSSAGVEGSQQREDFKRELSQNLSSASGLPYTNFDIKSMSPGSIVVNTEINPDVSGNFPNPETVARDLQSQVHDPNSPLRLGTITRYTESIVIPGSQPTPAARPPPRKNSGDRPPLPVQPAVSMNEPSSQVPAPPLLRGTTNEISAGLRDSSRDIPVQKSGVGVVFKRNDYGEIEIIGLRPNSSAERSGAIFVGNKIVSVGPIPVTGASRETVLDLILGTPNTRVTLGILRQAGSPGNESGQTDLASVTLVRADIASAPSSRAGSAPPMAAPDAAPQMMTLPDALSQTITKQKEPYDFVGAVRTVVLERSPGSGKPGEITGVGISFQATKSGGHMIVTRLVPHGPADLSKQIRVGDAILGVNNLAVQGKRIPEVVALIKGAPRSVVVFKLQHTTIGMDTLSQGSSSLYNSASSYMAMKGPGYESIPRAPALSSGSAPPMSAPGSAPPMSAPDSGGLHGVVQMGNAPLEWQGSAPPVSRGGSAGPMLPTEGVGVSGFRVVRLRRKILNPAFGPSIGGVGIAFERDQTGNHTVCSLSPGGTAAESGKILVGDKLLSVDGVPTQGLSVQQVSEMIRGKQDTDVALTLETVDHQSSVQQVLHTTLPPGNSLRQSGSSPLIDEGGVFAVGLVLSEPSPCKIVGSDLLMDCNHRLQGQQGYENETISVGDTILAINGKILQKQTLQQLTAMMSGPLHSEVTLMVQNTSGQGDEMFNIRLLRNMPITAYSHWSEYINSPGAPLLTSIQTEVANAEEQAQSISEPDAPAPSEQEKPLEAAEEPTVSKQKERHALRAPPPPSVDHVPELMNEKVKAFKLCVRVLEGDGLALAPDGKLPLCVANLRLIFPDEVSTEKSDTVPAAGPGQAVRFSEVELSYDIQVRRSSHKNETRMIPLRGCTCCLLAWCWHFLHLR